MIAGVGGMPAVALAGCSDGAGGETPTPVAYDHLGRRSVYVAPSLDIQVPATVSTVGSRADADVYLLPGETDVGARRAADWLADGQIVALLGPAAEATWLDWVRSRAFADALGRQGAAESEPDPDLLVAIPREDIVATSRATWARGYDGTDVFQHLEEALGHERVR